MNVLGGTLALMGGLLLAVLSIDSARTGRVPFMLRRPIVEPTPDQVRDGGAAGLCMGIGLIIFGAGLWVGGRTGYYLIGAGGALFVLGPAGIRVSSGLRAKAGRTDEATGDGTTVTGEPAASPKYLRRTRRVGILALCATGGMAALALGFHMTLSFYVVSVLAALAGIGAVDVLWPEVMAPRFQAADERRQRELRKERDGRPPGSFSDDLRMPPTDRSL